MNNEVTATYTVGIYDWEGLFSFFLTQLAYTLKELNDRYKEIKVYENVIKDEFFVKSLKTAVVYTLYLVRLKKSVTETGKDYLEIVENDLRKILESDLKNVSNVLDFKLALEIWLKILEYVSRISYGVRVIGGSEEREKYQTFTLE